MIVPMLMVAALLLAHVFGYTHIPFPARDALAASSVEGYMDNREQEGDLSGVTTSLVAHGEPDLAAHNEGDPTQNTDPQVDDLVRQSSGDPQSVGGSVPSVEATASDPVAKSPPATAGAELTDNSASPSDLGNTGLGVALPTAGPDEGFSGALAAEDAMEPESPDHIALPSLYGSQGFVADEKRLVSTGLKTKDNKHWTSFTFKPHSSLSLTSKYAETTGSTDHGIGQVSDAHQQTSSLKMRLSYTSQPSGFNFYTETTSTISDLGETADESTRQHLNVGASWKTGAFSFGGKHGVIENDISSFNRFRKPNDEEVYDYENVSEVWAKWKKGRFDVSTRWQDRSGVVDTLRSGSGRDLTENTIDINYSVLDWPYVGLNFSWDRSLETRNQNRSREPYQQLGGGVSFQNDKWYAGLYSYHLTPYEAPSTADADMSAWYHYFNASFQPIDTVYVEGAMGYADEVYRQMQANTSRKALSLSLTFSPPHSGLELTAYGSYDNEVTEAWQQGYDNYYLGGFAEWNLGQSQHGLKKLSLGFAYNVYRDTVYDSESASGGAWLLYRVGSASRSRAIPDRFGLEPSSFGQ